MSVERETVRFDELEKADAKREERLVTGSIESKVESRQKRLVTGSIESKVEWAVDAASLPGLNSRCWNCSCDVVLLQELDLDELDVGLVTLSLCTDLSVSVRVHSISGNVVSASRMTWLLL
jgi:hypothetical protein